MPSDVPSLIQALTTALSTARLTGQALDADAWRGAVLDEAQAYAVQDGVAAQWRGATPGRPVQHWKSGAAARSGPFSHAPLDPAGIGLLTGSARPWLGIEAEVALRLGRDVSPQAALRMQPEEADEWIDAMAVSVELIASRWQQQLAAPPLLRMADHQSHGALWLGPWQPYRRLDWAQLPWRLAQHGAAPIEQRGGHALDDPAWLLPAWLQHLSRGGITVPAGTVVTTGAWGGMQALSDASLAGAPIEVSFEQLGKHGLRLPA